MAAVNTISTTSPGDKFLDKLPDWVFTIATVIATTLILAIAFVGMPFVRLLKRTKKKHA